MGIIFLYFYENVICFPVCHIKLFFVGRRPKSVVNVDEDMAGLPLSGGLCRVLLPRPKDTIQCHKNRTQKHTINSIVRIISSSHVQAIARYGLNIGISKQWSLMPQQAITFSQLICFHESSQPASIFHGKHNAGSVQLCGTIGPTDHVFHVGSSGVYTSHSRRQPLIDPRERDRPPTIQNTAGTYTIASLQCLHKINGLF